MLDRLIMGVDEVEYRTTSDHLILSITRQDEWIEDDSWMIDEADHLPSFAPFRTTSFGAIAGCSIWSG